eukprot:UN10047
MIDKSVITSKSNVIEFGCGKGTAALQIVQRTKCNYIGIDLTESHIKQAQQQCDKAKVKNVQFEHNSFLDLDDKEHKNKYSHVFSQVAINHCHDRFDQVCQSAHNVLKKDGILVWCDFVGSDKKITKEMDNLLNRLKLPHLLSHHAFKEKIEENGFKILENNGYENLDRHAIYGYYLVAQNSREIVKNDWAEKW